MVVGVLRLTLVIPGARSLKDKRHALRRILERTRARYNVSIAEVGENDVWQRAQVGVTAVANDHSFVNEVLDKVVRDVESLAVAQLVNREMEIETYSEMHGDFRDKPLLDDLDGSGRGAPRADLGEGDDERDAQEYLREEDLE
jgi:uncharacterized protein YlxP (DUF503 family)